jgi:hypothetical protein
MPVNKKINKITAIVFLIISQFFLITPSLSQSSKPIRMGYGPGGATYVIPDDIKIETNGFSMKLIGEWDQPIRHNTGQFVKSIESHYSVVCTPRLFKLNMIVPRTGTMGTGDILSAAQRTPEWKSPEPKDHVINTIADIYCKN